MSAFNAFSKVNQALSEKIIGQSKLVERLILSILVDGHLLVEGPPGIAKTRSIQLLASAIDASFHRIQFTPDLLPSDITGSEIYRMEEHKFEFQKGPIFHKLVLADEINRAPAKVQSALLEAMAERQVTVGGTTHALSKLFMVMATQNSLEQEGTYPLPEAQLDRFAMKVLVDYPTNDNELKILHLARGEAGLELSPNIGAESIPESLVFEARAEILNLYMAPNLEKYLVELICATRSPKKYGDDLARWCQYGASPRATIYLDRLARAHAWLNGQDYVGPENIQAVAHDVLRHRIVMDYEAIGEGIGVERFVNELLNRIPVP